MADLKPHILITGGSGFIGRHVSAYLAERRYRIFSPSHRELDLTDGEKVSTYVARHGIEMIVHSAALPPAPAGATPEPNLSIFLNLANTFGRVKKIISFGSGAEYDKRRVLVRVKEEEFGRRVPADTYGRYKCTIGQHIEAHPGMINLRLFGVYGPGEDYRHKFISNAVVKNLLGHDIVINQNVLFHYLWVGDLGPIVEHFLTREVRHSSYNVVPDDTIDLLTIAALVNRQSLRPSKVSVLRAGLNREYTADNSRLRQEIPHLKFTDSAAGIRQLYQYYRSRVTELDADAIRQDGYLTRVRQSTEKGSEPPSQGR